MTAILSMLLVSLLAAPAIDHVIDGQFADWKHEPAIRASGTGFLQGLRAADDPHFVHLELEFSRPCTLQGLDHAVQIEFDLDGSDDTGDLGKDGLAGVDAVVIFSPIDTKKGKTKSGTALDGIARGERKRTTPDALGVVAMPTHASEKFEIRLQRLPAFRGSEFDVQAHLIAPDGTRESLPMLTHRYATKSATSPRVALADPAAPASASAVRTMSWNGEFGALFKRPAAFARTFEALTPDIIFLQELPDDCTTTKLTEWFDRLDGDHTWQCALGGSSLLCAVVTPHTFEPVIEFERLTAEDPRGRSRVVRAAGGLVTVNGKRILAIGLHLKCCGRLGSVEDQKRRAEVNSIREAARLAMRRLKPDAILVGGDFNLVGTDAILLRMCEGLAPDGSDLFATQPIRPAGDATTTWEKAKQAFVPGRLDFILAGGVERVTSALIVDPSQMTEAWRKLHGIPKEAPSDHLAVVVDCIVE